MRKRTILTLALMLTSVLLSGQPQDTSDIYWRPLKLFPIEGRAFLEDNRYFEPFGRFPRDMKEDDLSYGAKNSAGLYVKFRSDAQEFTFKWRMKGGGSGDNMSKINQHGLDLYVWFEGEWAYAGTARPRGKTDEYLQTVKCDVLEGEREYMLYLPMYGIVGDIQIGVPRGCSLLRSSFDSPCTDRPVIYYGSSIIQGGSTARPGLAITNRLSRMLDRTVVNLGFSGKAKLHYTVAEFMSRYPTPGAYVLDNLPNCTDSLVYERQENFYRILRDAHPDVPIIFVEDARSGRHDFNKQFSTRVATRNEAFKEVFDKLVASGEKHIYYVDGDGLIGPGYDSTIDGSHYTDEGALYYIDKVYPVLVQALQDAGLETPGLRRHNVLELVGKEGNPRNSEGDFIVCNDGRILFAYSKYVENAQDGGTSSVIALRESTDKGETWTREDKVVAGEGARARNASLLRLDKKRIALFYLREENGLSGGTGSRVMMKISRDEGASWGEEIECGEGMPPACREVNNSRVVRLSSGRILIPVSEDGGLYCLYSDDRCRSWKKSSVLEVADDEGKRVDAQNPGVIELGGGRILMYMSTDRGSLWFADSSDKGLTWGNARPSGLRSPCSPATMKRLGDGRLLLVWNDHANRDNLTAVNAFTPLCTAVSEDDGQTWSASRELEKEYNPKDEGRYHYCYTSVLELDDRMLLAYCSAHRCNDTRITVLPKGWIDGPDPAAEANKTLVPFPLYRRDGIPECNRDENRMFQSAPSITVSPEGRLWVCWHSGGIHEGLNNALIVTTSGDGGKTWSPVTMCIDEPGPLRVLDPGAWTDPSGKVWIFYCQVYDFWDGRGGIWATHPVDPESENPEWTVPRRLCDGYMKNKPAVLSDGKWLYPLEFFHREPLRAIETGTSRKITTMEEENIHMLQDMYGSVYASYDEGQNVRYLSRTIVPENESDCFEPMIVERKDGSLWLLCRTKSGIGESFSYDKGRTWTPVTPSGIQNPSARFYIGRLASGALLLVKNGPVDVQTTRKDISAYISDDEGKTWVGGLVLDTREKTSYPDAVQDKNGYIHVVNDFNRTAEKEILHHVFTEDDVRAGKLVSPGSRLCDIVNKAGSEK